MSLFRLKQIWSTQCSKTQEFDSAHLAIGSLGFEPVIAVGSFSGIVRIYKPGQQYRETDLIYMNDFGEPIVQVRIGVFINTLGNSLAILFVKKLIIINFSKTTSNTLILAKQQQFPLLTPCFSFQPVPLMVNSLNSQLFYLNPPSKAILKVSQPIYPLVISKITNSLYFMDGEQLVKSNNNAEQWRILVGEVSLIHLYQQKKNNIQIVCVGQKCIWQVDDNGIIIASKLVENQISCSAVVSVLNGYNILLGTFNQRLLVYHESKLVWAATCQFVPISLKIIDVNNKPGFIVLLSDSGNLDICYLGTDSPVQSMQNRSKQLDIKQIDEQIYKLQQKLAEKNNQISNKVTGTKPSNKNDPLQIQIQSCKVESADDGYVQNSQKFFQINNQIRRLRIQISLKNNASKLYDIKVIIQLPGNLYTQTPTLSIDEMTSNNVIRQVFIYAYNDKFCYQNSLTLSTTYFAQLSKGKQGQIFTNNLQISIPLNFQCTRIPNSKVEKASHKVILIANRQIPNFMNLFNDVVLIGSDNSGITTQHTFRLSSGSETSIIASKSSSKYKIQSDFYQGLCLILIQFIKRVQNLKIDLTIQAVPLEELFLITESHFQTKKKLKNLSKVLEQKSLQFRLIEKRILSKLKQKSSQLNSLDTVLQQSYKNLLQQCNKFEQTQQQYSIVHHQLMISIKIVCELLFLRGKTSENAKKTINGVLKVDNNERYSADWGWEQQVFVNSAILLKKKINQNEIQQIQYDRIKKILMWLVDKTAKGEIN